MASTILKMKLENIQSWKSDNQVIDFAEDKLNVVRAKSETGKSVIFKVFYQMVFPSYYKYHSKNNLIREGCQSGKVTFWMGDGSIVIFYLEHSNQHFEWIKEGEQPITYWQKEMPQPLIEEFGLIVDYELGFILNVYTKDNPYPFIQTTNAWNASILNQVFSNAKVETALLNMKDWVMDLTKDHNKLATIKEYRTRNFEALKYVDVEELQRHTKVIKECAKMYDVLSDVGSSFAKLMDAQKMLEECNYSAFNIVEINDIKVLYEKLEKLSFLMQKVNTNQQYLESLPGESIDLGNLANIRNLVALLGKLESRFASLKKSEAILEECEGLLDSKTVELSRLEKFKGDLETVGETKRKLGAIYMKLNKVNSEMASFIQLHNHQAKLNAELQEVKSKIEICPTCKRPL